MAKHAEPVRTEDQSATLGSYALLGALPSDPDEMPRVRFTRDRVIFMAVFVASALAFLYFVLPHVAGLGETWDRINTGDPAWLAAALGFELASFGGYVALFRTVFVRGDTRIGWRESYLITMAGLAATRLFAAAGAGGIALTAWALRRSGMEPKLVACRMVAFTALLYIVYLLALLIDGLALRTGVFPGGGSFAITIIPAIFGGGVLVVITLVAFVPADVAARIERRAKGQGRTARWMARVVTVPALGASGVRTALAIVRAREPGTLGALAWWGFDIATLWAAFHAFGAPPAFSVIVMAYFVGMLANVLPLPGGIGGVEGGMIGSLIAFGVDGGLAVVAVLVYRGFSFWLPTVPGAIAYLQLRRTVNRWRGEGEPAPHQALHYTK